MGHACIQTRFQCNGFSRPNPCGSSANMANHCGPQRGPWGNQGSNNQPIIIVAPQGPSAQQGFGAQQGLGAQQGIGAQQGLSRDQLSAIQQRMDLLQAENAKLKAGKKGGKKGGFLGNLLGGLGGAGVGFLLGGPVGAVIGGVGGSLLGGLFGSKKGENNAEKDAIYRDAIDDARLNGSPEYGSYR